MEYNTTEVGNKGSRSPSPPVENQVDADRRKHLRERSSKSDGPTPITTKVNGVTVRQGNVIPKREASRIPKHYMTVSRALMRSTAFAPNEKLVITFLIDSLGQEHDYCWPGLETIVAETGTPRRTVIDILNRLIAAKLIFKVAGGGSGISTRYYLTQALHPCQRHPATLCDRDACQEECSWKINSAVTAPLSPAQAETEQCGDRTLSDENSAVTAPSIPINSAVTAPEEKNNRDRKEHRGEKKVPPGGRRPTDLPSSGVTVKGSGSGHSQVKDHMLEQYQMVMGRPYIWGGIDGKMTKVLLDMDLSVDEIKRAMEVMFSDTWARGKNLFSMKLLRSGINQYRGKAAAGSAWNEGIIDVHTQYQPGQELIPWPWPRRYSHRNDGDIPGKNRNWGIYQFDQDLIKAVSGWMWNPDRNQGWCITFLGLYGNGKSSLAGALLQAWRDHMTPDMDVIPNDTLVGQLLEPDKSHFLTHELFKASACLKSKNETTGYIGQPEIDQEYIDRLSSKAFLVIDDLCSGDLNKIQTEALHDLLRTRAARGYQTVITSNRTLAELDGILGGSVVDRLKSGPVLRFVDDSNRNGTVTHGQALEDARHRPPTVPNPSGDIDKACILVEDAAAEEAAQAEALEAAIASIEPASQLTGEVA